MDKRDEIAKKCLLVKSVSPGTDLTTVREYIGRLKEVVRICQHTEHSDRNIRFIVQLSSAEDADELVAANNLWILGSKVDLGLCPDCILPNDWLDQNVDLHNKDMTRETTPHTTSSLEMKPAFGDDSSEDEKDYGNDYQNNFFDKEENKPRSIMRADSYIPAHGTNVSEEDDKYIPQFTIPSKPISNVTKEPEMGSNTDTVIDNESIGSQEQKICSDTTEQAAHTAEDTEVTEHQPGDLNQGNYFSYNASEQQTATDNICSKMNDLHMEPRPEDIQQEEQLGSNQKESNPDEASDESKALRTGKKLLAASNNTEETLQTNCKPITNPPETKLDLQSVQNQQHTSPEINPCSAQNYNPQGVHYMNVQEVESAAIGNQQVQRSNEAPLNHPSPAQNQSPHGPGFQIRNQPGKEESAAIGNQQGQRSNEAPLNHPPAAQNQAPLVPGFQICNQPGKVESAAVGNQQGQRSNEAPLNHPSPAQNQSPHGPGFQIRNQPGKEESAAIGNQQGQMSNVAPYNSPAAQNQTELVPGFQICNQPWKVESAAIGNQQGQMLNVAPYNSPAAVQNQAQLGPGYPLYNQPAFNPMMPQRFQMPIGYMYPPGMMGNPGMFYPPPMMQGNMYRPVAPPGEQFLMPGPVTSTPIVPTAPDPTSNMADRGGITPINGDGQLVPTPAIAEKETSKTKDQKTEELRVKSKSEEEELRELKELKEWSQSGAPPITSDPMKDRAQRQGEIDPDACDDKKSLIHRKLSDVKHPRGRRQRDESPMEWQDSSHGGARQKTSSGTVPRDRRVSTESDDSDFDSNHGGWASNPDIIELNYGTLLVVKGDLSKMEVDVIVNSTNADLDLKRGRVSKSLLMDGGDKIQQACKKKHPDGIKPGEIAITKGYKLKCRKLFHCIVPKWDGGEGPATRHLRHLYKNCLDKAAELSLHSIAFPALGTGKLGFPVDIVAQEIIGAVNDKSTDSLKRVVVVLYPRDSAALKAFEQISFQLLGSPYTRTLSQEDSNDYENLDGKPSDHHYEGLDGRGSAHPSDGLDGSRSRHHYESIDGSRLRPHYESIDGIRSPPSHENFRPVASHAAGKGHHGGHKEETHVYDTIKEQEEPLYVSIKPTIPDLLYLRWSEPLTEDTLKFFFENSKKSHGGTIKRFEYNEEFKDGRIEFEDPKVVDQVLKKSNHFKVSKVTVDVEKVKGEGIEDKKVLVNGLNPDTTEDCLLNYLEVVAKSKPEAIVYGDSKERAIVTFEDPPDIEKVKAMCEKRKLEGQRIKVSMVPVSRSILVTGLPEQVSGDTVSYFFENEKRSGGGEVEKVKLDDQEAVVVFKDPSDAKRVLKKKKLVLSNHPLKVSVYYPYLHPHGQKAKVPDPVVLQDIDSNVVKFVLASNPNKEALTSSLRKAQAHIQLPLDPQSGQIVITCDIDPKCQNAGTLLRSWKDEVEKISGKFFGTLCKEEVPVSQQVWGDVIYKLETIDITYPDDVAVVLNSKDKSVVIVGHKQFVLDLKNKIVNIVTEAEKKLKELTQKVTKKENLKMFQVQLLWQSYFNHDLNKSYPQLEVDIDINSKQVTLTGSLNDVESARKELHKRLDSFVSTPMDLTEGKKELFRKATGKEFIMKEMKSRKLLFVWDFPPRTGFCEVYGRSKSENRKAIDIVNDLLPSKKIIMEDNFSDFLASTHWHKTNKVMNDKYPDKFVINSGQNVINVTALSDVFGEILKMVEREIQDFKDLHSVSTQFLQVSTGVLKYMQKYKKSDVDNIVQSLQKLKVSLEVCDSRLDCGFEILGTKDGIKMAEKRLSTLIARVKQDSCRVKQFGAAEFFTSEDGQDKVNSLQSVHSCIIKKKGEHWGQSGRSKPPITLATCRLRNDKSIIVVKGDMTGLTVDVIVNAANEDLAHGAGLAGAIVDAGGEEIQRECIKIIKRKGRLNVGDAVASKAGRLPCKMIVHAVGPVWHGGRHQEASKLRQAVRASLHLAKFRESIALPALSAGIFGYPVDQSVKEIVKVVQDFLEGEDCGSIREVYFCDTSDKNANCFTEELKQVFGKKYVQDCRTSNQGISDSDDQSSDEEIYYDNIKVQDIPRSDKGPSIRIQTIKGEIAQTKVDVIVNSTQPDLQLNSGALSKSLLRHGGPILQQECTSKYPNGIQPSEVAVTGGGSLSCRLVYHGTFPRWDGRGVCSKILRDFVQLCLATAEQQGMNSLAFPALGTGQLNYPASVVADVMYKAVTDYNKDNPRTKITKVMFVVYPQDVSAVQEFETVEQRMKSGDQHRGAGLGAASLHKKNDGADTLGHIQINIKQGDITASKVDVIVNSTGDHLDLSIGALSRAIIKSGGPEIQVECNRQKHNMNRHGLVVTSGGNLTCKKIIHVKAHTDPDLWEQTVTDCLSQMGGLQFTSIAFPALGTGKASCDPTQIAKAMFRAIKSFPKQSKPLKVHIVIYQTEMVQVFKSVLAKVQGKSSGGGYATSRRTSEEEGAVEPVEFLIWSDSEADIKKAKKGITTILEKEFKEHPIKGYADIIKKLSPYQEKEIRKVAQRHKVKLNMDISRGEITLFGRLADVSNCHMDIYKLLRDYEKYTENIEKGKLVASYVQWFYEDNGKSQRFNAMVNHDIETAYASKKNSVKIKDGKGVKYVVDFSSMVEYEEKNPQNKFKIERRDLRSGGDNLPSSWTSMPKGTSAQLVKLATSDQEYIKVSQLFTAGTGIGNVHQKAYQMQVGNPMYQQLGYQYGGMPAQSGIIKIERIQNKYLYQQYIAKKKELRARNGKDPEQMLWHGTSGDTVDKIIHNGFNRSYCGKNGTAYGNGVYFAVDASYSVGYCKGSSPKRMFLVQVLTGETCGGHGGMANLPYRTGTTPYDSACDRPGGASMYVIFHDSQAYPKYLITFN